MNLDELKAQWRKDEGEPLDPPGVEDLIARTSTLGCDVGNRLTAW